LLIPLISRPEATIQFLFATIDDIGRGTFICQRDGEIFQAAIPIRYSSGIVNGNITPDGKYLALIRNEQAVDHLKLIFVRMPHENVLDQNVRLEHSLMDTLASRNGDPDNTAFSITVQNDHIATFLAQRSKKKRKIVVLHRTEYKEEAQPG
jgi:hypothetical protein